MTREEAQRYEDIAKAFQFGLAFGFGKKYDEMDSVIDEIKKVITPQPKTGYWIHELGDWNRWTCSECGFTKRTDIHVSLGYNFCPRCGAMIVEPQAENEDEESNDGWCNTCEYKHLESECLGCAKYDEYGNLIALSRYKKESEE